MGSGRSKERRTDCWKQRFWHEQTMRSWAAKAHFVVVVPVTARPAAFFTATVRGVALSLILIMASGSLLMLALMPTESVLSSTSWPSFLRHLQRDAMRWWCSLHARRLQHWPWPLEAPIYGQEGENRRRYSFFSTEYFLDCLVYKLKKPENTNIMESQNFQF